MSTPIPQELRIRLDNLLRSLPESSSVPGERSARTVEQLATFLDKYVADQEVRRAKVQEENRRNQRAAVVLRGLRTNLANAIDTLAELDEAES